MRHERQVKAGSMILALAFCVVPCHAGEVRVDYAYNLSDFTGTIPVSHPALSVDRDGGEIYMVYQNVVRIFNAAGMETFSFGDPDPGLLILGVAVGGDDIFALVRNFRTSETGAQYLIQRRDYRGDLLETHKITVLPGDAPELDPSKIFFRDGRLLLVDKARMLVVETDPTGATVKVHDLAGMLGLSSTADHSAQIAGFDLDPNGNMLITIPVLFRAFVISPDGTVRSFGKGGSVPGTFGIAAGITRDSHGRTYVSDRLRSVVIVFDADFRFVTEFGYRGRRPENLIIPSELVSDNSGKLYVTQRRNRGVAVFTVTDTERTAPESSQTSVRTQDRKEVLAETAGDSFQRTSNRKVSGFDTTDSDPTQTVYVGPDAEPLHDGLGTLERRALPGRRHEEKP